jgi:signal transduction histidine kinase/ActR/RegA family two-component response regulator
MHAKKRLIICAASFLIVFGLGIFWANSDPVELTAGQRLSISVVLGVLAAIALFYLLRQAASIQQDSEAEHRFNLARDEFVANVSHEIRTPLSGILGVMHLLRRTQLDRNQQRYIDTASNSANMLLTIINDVLAYTRMDSTWFPMELESLDLAEVIEDVTSILAPEAINKGLELVSDIDPNIPHQIKGDALRLRQVLNNLLNNAIKNTENGMVAIYAVSKDGSIEIGVKDSGAGVDPEQQHLLLLPFSEMENRYIQEPGGIGLGLKSSRRLLEAMNSSLQINSSPGEGSCFYFELTIDAEQHKAYDWKPPQALQGLSVAILSPLELQRSSICKMLAHWNIAAVQQVDYDADQSPDLPDLTPCDVLIIDQTETEGAVNKLIDRLRNQSDWRETRFVHLVPQNREEEGGSADVRLYKPLSHSRLYTTVLDIVYKLAFDSEYAPAQDGAAPGVPGILAGHRILLVEDNDINKMIALEMLEETGVDVDVAINGADAVAQVQQQGYELILMDIQMPIMDGYEATRQIRALGGEFKSIPIIAMTAHALEGDSSKSLEAGMDYHISKPFEPDDLIAIIARFIEQRSQ